MFELKASKDIQFSSDGRYVVVANSPNYLGIWKFDNSAMLDHKKTVERLANTNFHVYNNELIYVDPEGRIKKLHNFSSEDELTKINPDMGLIGYKPNGEPVIFQIGADKKEKIVEYVIEYDTITGKSCLIVKYNDNTFRTVIVSSNGVDFDSTDIGYAAKHLDQIKFYNDLIWVPMECKITTFSYKDKVVQDLYCVYVEKKSRLNFDGEYLRILNPKSAYKVKLKKIKKELENI